MESTTPSVPNAVAREPPLPQKAGNEVDRCGGDIFCWVEMAVFGFLTFSFVRTAYRLLRDDPRDVAFVAFWYLDLVLLWYCLKRYEQAEPGSPPRHRLSALVSLLTAPLTLVSAYKVADVLPAAAAAFAWVIGLATAARGFVALLRVKQT